MNQSSSATGSSLLPLLRVPFSSAARSSSTSLQQSLRMGGYHAYGIHPDRLFGVGALAPRGLPPFLGGLCGDLSPHRTTMTQTKRCPIFKFGSWWCFSRQTPQESDCEINASFVAASLLPVVAAPVHLVLLTVFMEVSPIFTIWLAVLRVSFWWGVWYFEAAWLRCRLCFGWFLVA